MSRARGHRRLAGFGSFALLALAAELAGRSLTIRLDLGRHVPTPSYSGADYYPFLLAAVKTSVALMLAALTWRFIKARAAARAARRLLVRAGARPQDVPRMRMRVSVRSWAVAFGLTAGFYLVQTDSERFAAGRWPLMSPWLHTSALSVFAVLAVVVALLHGAVSRWLSDYERYAKDAVATARSLLRRVRLVTTPPDRSEFDPPRRLFGLAFESRPPPPAVA
jgi:hypothetical protein